MNGSGAPPQDGWFRQVAERSGLVFFVIRVQPDVAIEFVTEGVRWQPDYPVDPRQADELDRALRLLPGREAEFELSWRTPDGGQMHSRIWLRSVRRADGSVALEGVGRDTTALHQAEHELQVSEQRYRLLAENAWEVIWTMALDGTITYVSPAVERVRGITPEEAKRQSLEEIHPPESAASVRNYYERLFGAIAAGAELPTFRGEHEYYRKDGSIMTGELQVIPHVGADGEVVEILGVTRDISERKQFEAELTRLADTDAVTATWNRRHGEALLSAELDQVGPERPGPSLLMFDIDHFKTVNDRYGHQAGDEVLAQVAALLRDSVSGNDAVARWGGEEFIALLRGCGPADAETIAEKIRARIAGFRFDGAESVTISIGVAEAVPGDDVDSWVARADEALYRAKRSGRNAVRH